MGRCHSTWAVAILTGMPTLSSGCTAGINSQGCGCQQLRKTSARGRLCVLLQSFKESPGTHQNIPAGPQNLAQHIHGHFFFIYFLEHFAGGLACLAKGFLTISFWNFARERERKGNPSCGWHPVTGLPLPQTSAATNQCQEFSAQASSTLTQGKQGWQQSSATCISLNIWTWPSFSAHLNIRGEGFPETVLKSLTANSNPAITTRSQGYNRIETLF